MKRTHSPTQQERQHEEETRALKRRHQEQMAALRRTVLASVESLTAAVAATGGAAPSAPPSSTADELASLKEELETAQQMFHDLSMLHSTVKAELNEAKERLVKAAAEEEDMAGVLPIRVFCEATDDEIHTAWRAGGRPRYKWHHAAVVKEVDDAIRNAGFDPWIRRRGGITGVNEQHPVLQTLRERWGEPIAALVVEKKREIEEHCPSGSYPTPVLYENGKVLRMGEAVERLLKALKTARAQARPPPRACRATGSSPLVTTTPAAGRDEGVACPPHTPAVVRVRSTGTTSSSSSASSSHSPVNGAVRDLQRKEEEEEEEEGGGGGAQSSSDEEEEDDSSEEDSEDSEDTEEDEEEEEEEEEEERGTGRPRNHNHSKDAAGPGMAPGLQDDFLRWLVGKVRGCKARSYRNCVNKLIQLATRTENRGGGGAGEEELVLLRDKAAGRAFIRTYEAAIAEHVKKKGRYYRSAYNAFAAFVRGSKLVQPPTASASSPPARVAPMEVGRAQPPPPPLPSEVAAAPNPQSSAADLQQQQQAIPGTIPKELASKSVMTREFKTDFARFLEKRHQLTTTLARAHGSHLDRMMLQVSMEHGGGAMDMVQDKEAGREFVRAWGEVMDELLEGKNEMYHKSYEYFQDYVACEDSSNVGERASRLSGHKKHVLSFEFASEFVEFLEVACGLPTTAARAHGSNVDALMVEAIEACTVDGPLEKDKILDRATGLLFASDWGDAVVRHLTRSKEIYSTSWRAFLAFVHGRPSMMRAEEDAASGDARGRTAPGSSSTTTMSIGNSSGGGTRFHGE